LGIAQKFVQLGCLVEGVAIVVAVAIVAVIIAVIVVAEGGGRGKLQRAPNTTIVPLAFAGVQREGLDR